MTAAQVQRFANKVHGQLKEWERTDLGDRIQAEAARWSENDLVVVTCGDIKRGKSSLLNELLGQPDLLPVDADVATSVHLVVRHGDEPTIVVTRIGPDGEPQQQRIPRATLVDHASMQGDPATREGVVSVEIRLPHPLLARGIVLVDTPGVGGLSRGHRDLALAAIARADALLFTMSASEPIARSELEFLAEASERTDRVVFVVTKSDLNDEETNRAMVAEHRAKLAAFTDTMLDRAREGVADAESAGRLRRLAQGAPFVLTSSHLASQARRRHAAGREEQAKELLGRSGIPMLAGLLDRSAQHRDDIRAANLCGLLSSLLGDVDRQTRALAQAADGRPEAAEELVARQAELERFGSKQARWRTSLGNTIVRLQTNSSRLVTRELTRVKEHYAELVARTTDAEALADALPGELERSLHGAWNEMVATINAEFTSAIGAFLEEFGATGMDVVLGAIEMPEELRTLAAAGVSGQPATRSSFLDDGLPVALQTFSFASIANAAAGVLGLATGGLGLAAYGIGAVLAYPIGALRRRTRERQRLSADLQRFVNDALFGPEGVAKEFSTELSLRILDLREQVEQFVDQRLAERRKQLERETRELQQVLKAESGRRQQAHHAAKERLQRVAELRAELDAVRRGPAESTPPPS